MSLLLLGSLVFVGVALVYLLGLWIFQPVIVAKRTSGKTFASEDFFVTSTKSQKKSAFPSITDAPQVTITVIAPAYNEELRITPMLDDTLRYLEQWKQQDRTFTYEIIVVDDCSKDKTVDIVMGYVDRHGSDTIRVLKLQENRGKGGAIRHAVFRSRGQYILMADSDGATDIRDLQKLFTRLKAVEKPSASGSLGLGVGSRAHMQDEAVATRAWYRTVLMYGLHVLVYILCSRSIRDTQCGFKLFTRETARQLFTALHLERWAFDLELIYLSETNGIPMVEVPVNWQEIDGSKLIQTRMDIITTSLSMARDMLCVRLAYMLGMWDGSLARVAQARKVKTN